MSGRETPGVAAPGSHAERLEPSQQPDRGTSVGSSASALTAAAGTEAVTTQYRKMSVSDGMPPAGQAALSDSALPELMPESHSAAACNNPEMSTQLGDEAAQEQNYVDAIKFYTHALTPSESSVEILCKRADAMVRFAHHTRGRSSSQLDEDVVAGPDAETLAMMALRDVKKILDLDSMCATAYLYKGRALHVLEEYDDAADALQVGLNLDMQHSDLLAELKAVNALRASTRAAQLSARQAATVPQGKSTSACDGRAVKRARGPSDGASKEEDGPDGSLPEDDFKCPLCVKLLFEPVTTPCGHTFCRGCLMRSLDHTNRCPMCRTVLHTSARKHPISVSLQSILSKHFPAETDQRRNEETEEVNHGPCVLPLFVVDYVLPGQALALNVFEPRYRLMIRRCLDGDRRFGMLGSVQPVPAGTKEFGCEVEIQDSRQLHDGRYHIQVRVIRRFWIVKKWDLDGYRIARVTFFSDDDKGSAHHSAFPAPAPASASAAVDTLAAREDSAPGSDLPNTGDEKVARARAPPAACTRSEHSSSDTAADGGASASAGEAVIPSSTAQTCVPAGVSGRSSGSVCAPGLNKPLEVSQQPTVDARSAAPVAPEAREAAGAETAVVYSAQVRQMARHVQITVKEWLVRAKSLSKHSTKMSVLFRQLVARAGRPPADPYKDLELYSFWVGNILPTSTRDRQEMLEARSTQQRMVILLRLMMETIEQTRLSAEDVGLALNSGGGGFSRVGTATNDTGGGGGGEGAGGAGAAGAAAAPATSAAAAAAAAAAAEAEAENATSGASDSGGTRSVDGSSPGAART